jgi:hypothetical protein
VGNPNVRERPTGLEDNMVDPDGRDSSHAGDPVAAADPDQFIPVFGVEQTIANAAPTAHRNGRRLLLGLEYLVELPPQPARDFDQIRVPKRVHGFSKIITNIIKQR